MAFESGVQASSQGRAQLKYGTYNEADGLFVGRSIKECREARGDAWNIPADARAYKGRDVLDDEYVVKDGDVIEFHRRMGEKG